MTDAVTLMMDDVTQAIGDANAAMATNFPRPVAMRLDQNGCVVLSDSDVQRIADELEKRFADKPIILETKREANTPAHRRRNP